MNSIYYLPYENFGDELPSYLIKKITGRKDLALSCPPPFQSPTLVSIGSIIDLNILNKNSVIWGTGTLTEESLYPSLKLFPISRLCRLIRQRCSIAQPKIHAVRGPRTRDMLLKLGMKCPALYGDPAILLPKLYVAKVPRNHFSFGLILHHTHHLTAGLTKFCRQNGILPISIFRKGDVDIESFINEICSCDKIFSSSLHGLIVAQAYGVPAQWIRIKGCPIHKDDWHKFEDYFLGAYQDNQNAIEIELTEKGIYSLVKVIPPEIKQFKGAEALMDVFPKEFMAGA